MTGQNAIRATIDRSKRYTSPSSREIVKVDVGKGRKAQATCQTSKGEGKVGVSDPGDVLSDLSDYKT
jgi:hypothetical protein